MSILVWVAVGLVAGLLAQSVAGRYGPIEDVIVAVVGSIAGGWIFAELARIPVTDITLPALLPALAGAVLFLLLARSITRDRETI